MAIRSGFFNSVDKDRLYNAEDMSHYFEGLITDGVYESIGNKLQVTANNDMTVSVQTGRAMIDCHWLKNDSIYNLSIDSADVQYDRYDFVVVKLDLNPEVRDMTIEILPGTPGGGTPTIKPTDKIKYLVLARITVSANTKSIAQANIFDLRGTADCPWITGLIKQVDTSQLFSQWQDACESFYKRMTDAFETWFNALTGELRVDTYIEKLENSYLTTEEVSELDIGIEEYEPDDILFVNINGVQFVENVEYTISENKIILNNSIKADNRVTFIVLKSKIGSVKV